MKPFVLAACLLLPLSLPCVLPAQESAPASRRVIPPITVRITGRVVDDLTGLPVPAFDLGFSRGLAIKSSSKRRFDSPDGRFDYPAAIFSESTRELLLAKAPGYAGGRSAELRLAQGEDLAGVEIRLIRGATLTGRVLDSAGSPILKAAVTLEPPPLPPGTIICPVEFPELNRVLPETATDASGSFELPRLLPGEFVLTIRHPEFGPHQTESFTTPASGKAVRPDVHLVRAGVIRGRVSLPDGAPDPKAGVSVYLIGSRYGGVHHRTVSTDAKGRFEVGGLQPGEYSVVVGMRNGQPDFTDLFASHKRLVTIAAGDVKELDL